LVGYPLTPRGGRDVVSIPGWEVKTPDICKANAARKMKGEFIMIRRKANCKIEPAGTKSLQEENRAA